MPPRPSGTLTSSFSVSDPANEVVCPLVNTDGSACRKRCFGEKRYRSMQEHIRRAHPAYYIPKLPASAESIRQMVEKEPDENAVVHTSPIAARNTDQMVQQEPSSYNSTMFSPNHLRRGSLLQSANAAAALAQLHNSRPEPDWQGHQDAYGDPEHESEYIHNYFADGTQDLFPEGQVPPDMSSQMMQPFDRSFFPRASLQNFVRKPNRPRKSSITENARKGKHERDRSKELKRLSHDRKGHNLEPANKRWEDLLDAAQSANEEESRDLTPIPQSPRASLPPFQHQPALPSYTASPLQNAILPHEVTEDSSTTFNHGIEPFPSVESSYEASQPYAHQHHLSADSAPSNLYSYSSQRHHASSSGSNFHMPSEGLSSPHDAQANHFARPRSSTTGTHFPHLLNAAHLAQTAQQDRPHPYSAHHASFSVPSATPVHNTQHLQEPAPPLVQHYCAACNRITPLVQSYACTECICGICRDCFDVLTSMDPDRSTGCPHCHVQGGKYKPFMLDLR